MVSWAWQLEKHLHRTCSLNEYDRRCWGGWEKRKMNRSCVKFISFSSHGFELTSFSFHSCRFPSFGEKLWLSGWKKLNGAETTLFDVLSGWVEEKKEVKRLPQTPSNFSYKNLLLVHLHSSVIPGQLSSQLDSSWIRNPNSHLFSFSWRPNPRAQAHPRGSRAGLWGRGKTYPERPTCPQMSLCWPFWNTPWGLGRWSAENRGWNLTSTIYYLYELGGVGEGRLFIPKLFYFFN